MLDEPTNALDPAGVILLRESLLRRAAAGAGILVSSHHLDEVARVADRITVINDGRAIGSLDPDGVDLERAFFDLVLSDDAARELGDDTPRPRHERHASAPRGLLRAAIAVEARKARSSHVMLWTTVLLVVGVGALALGILAAVASGEEQVIAKLGPLAGVGGWAGLVGIVVQITAAGGLAAFGVALSWMFGREFADGTVCVAVRAAGAACGDRPRQAHRLRDLGGRGRGAAHRRRRGASGS